MFHRFVGRTRVVAGNRDIADIADVLNAFGRTEISTKYQASEAAEKTGGPFKLSNLILGTVGDVVHNRRVLFCSQVNKVTAKAQLRLIVQPLQSVHNLLPVALLTRIGGADPLINHIRHTHRGCRRAALICRTDKITEHRHLILLRLVQGQRPGDCWCRHNRVSAVARPGDGLRLDAGPVTRRWRTCGLWRFRFDGVTGNRHTSHHYHCRHGAETFDAFPATHPGLINLAHSVNAPLML